MTKPIISVEGLSKSYTISHQSGSNGRAGGYLRLSEELLSYPRQFFSRFSSLATRDSSTEEFWALKDVSFEVKEGEVVGIIGRNGAGKSTLLKILSRITEPTSGRVRLRGRVASLLEVGTGFHPELTGRENILLNGAILGMSRSEIMRKFEEIVHFAEIERFLDTPVKRYSSGMYVRLAFAVAAHLEPEILIVDEVLAVGDYQFQKKCMGKMKEVADGDGKTVIFVSHNMGAVRSLCKTAVQLQSGVVTAIGTAIDVTDQFLHGGNTASSASSPEFALKRLDAVLDMTGFELVPSIVLSGESLRICVTLCARQATAIHEASVIIHSQSGQRVAIIDLRSPEGPVQIRQGCVRSFIVDLNAIPLMEGLYEVGFYYRSDQSQNEFFALRDLIVAAGKTCCLVSPYPAQNRGYVELDYDFRVEPDNQNS